MNPFLEQAAHCQDFHTELLTTIRRALTPKSALAAEGAAWAKQIVSAV
jgi:hypothetical protein